MTAATLRVRRATGAQWISANPILGLGEMSFETDTKQLKVGDGSTVYTSLAYVTGGGGGGAIHSTDIVDSTTTGRSLLTAASAAAARTVLSALASSTTLNAIAAPVAALAMNSQKITGLANGTASSDAAAFGQIASAVAGLMSTSTPVTQAQQVAGAVEFVAYSGSWPARPTSRTDIMVIWCAPLHTTPTPTGFVAGVDYMFQPL